ncbi:hypothetical protein GCM10007276_25460 [Agaricicola taiwanensis]|uniref:DUF983 domain-containing protein n=1 Tax=Agaricicola taiwanensis TaxID=591372 RepID=A0A8J2YJ51_9RHOB|nr:DUF983 domain-containing protein [Agaricicola taiwanensis]GGE47228.1 hypothetical protein GCM10007276_25460 [Agaricicola taiwanensis]
MPYEIKDPAGERSAKSAMLRGLRGRCPRCGEGRIFGRYLKVNEECSACGEALYHHRADDAPPYVVITVVGHIVVGLALAMERSLQPDLWIHMMIWAPLTLLLSLLMLQPVKGALIGMQWAFKMHGFDPESPEAQEPPPSLAAS